MNAQRGIRYRTGAPWGLCLIVAVTMLPVATEARVWRVEKDGSGDFTVIQDAVDTAAPGDTVSIGPGRFDDFRFFTFSTGGTGAQTVIGLRESLTILGTPGKTIVGPPELVEETGGVETAGVSINVEAGGATVTGVTIENVYAGLAVFSSTPTGMVTISDCDVSGFSNVGVLLGAPNCVFKRTEFHDGIDPRWAIDITTANVDGLVLEDCEFRGAGPHPGGGVDLAIAQGVRISGSWFSGYIVAIQVNFGARATIESCVFSDNRNAHLDVTLGGAVQLQDCRLEPGGFRAVRVANAGHLGGTRTLFGAGIGQTIWNPGNATIHLDHCEIQRGGTYAVEAIVNDGPGVQLDMRNNWWGTADSLKIAEMILDGSDFDPDAGLASVDFVPFLEGPVPTQVETISGLKALFSPTPHSTGERESP